MSLSVPAAVTPAHGAPAVSPGRERLVRPDELFFSTTDRRGLIRSGNSVFARISGYPEHELAGAPHNLVRHPDMPAGAFALMWQRLLAGRPMAAYVQNLTKDGATYWVFATVTPHRDGFLSVRMSPAGPLFGAARDLYGTVREYERRVAAERGVSGPELAAAGAEYLERRLHRLGYAGYDEFMLEALPAEVAARGSLVSTSFARPAAGGPLGQVLRATAELDGRLDDLVHRLEGYGSLAAGLLGSARAVLEHSRRLELAVNAARRASADVAQAAPVLLNVAEVMAGPMSASVQALQQLSPQLEQLHADVRTLRFGIALARLHTEMVASFVAETVDGAAPRSALLQVPELCDEVGTGVQRMARQAGSVNRRLVDVADQVRTAGALLEDFRRFLGQWRILAVRHRQAAALYDLIGPIDDQLEAGHDQRDHLRDLALACEQAVTPFDAEALERVVGQIRAATAEA